MHNNDGNEFVYTTEGSRKYLSHLRSYMQGLTEYIYHHHNSSLKLI